MLTRSDVEDFLTFWFTGNANLKSLLAGLLLVALIALVILLCVVVVRLRKWTSYEAWESRKKRLMKRCDRPMPHAGETLDLHWQFLVDWKKQSFLARVRWILTGEA